MEHTDISKFGKDHWSTFAYADCCRSDNIPLNPTRMRTNENTHPTMAANSTLFKFKPENGTRLHGYFKAKSNGDDVSGLILPAHDDWDCIFDLEAAGLLSLQSMANPYISLTEYGEKVASDLRRFKAEGGQFADFVSAAPASKNKVKI